MELVKEQLFEYAVVVHPSKKQHEKGLKSFILDSHKYLFGKNEEYIKDNVKINHIGKLLEEHNNTKSHNTIKMYPITIEQVEVLVRPFRG